MQTLKDKVIFITGGSRGIGREIALRCAKDGAKIVIAAKTDQPHPKLEGTIHSVADEIVAAGGQALPIMLDIRNEEGVKLAVKQAADHFGGIDILVNNASAISLTTTLDTTMNKFDLMMDVNMRGTFICSQQCIPYLKESNNPHILTLSPPLNMKPKWFQKTLVYTMSKFGMSMCTLGMAAEFKEIKINSLWPKTIIATAAIKYNFPEKLLQACRNPSIMADAAYKIFTESQITSGNFYIDEEVLAQSGVSDLQHYAINPKVPLYPDLFVE